MTYLENIKQQLVAEINQLLPGADLTVASFVYPPNPALGDLALPLFTLAAKLGLKPTDLSTDLSTKLSANNNYTCLAAGPYLNFVLADQLLAETVLTEIADQGTNYGKLKLPISQEAMIEYSNVNTHKDYHLGHLRNITYGDAINRLYAAVGYTVWPVSYVNDFGIHTAKTIWAWQRHNFGQPSEDNLSKGYELGQAYVQAVADLTDNPTGAEEVSSIMQQIEARQGDAYELWLETRNWSLDYFGSIYAELGVDFKEVYYESDYIDEGRRLVDELLAKGILKRSQGAVIADLEEYGLGVLVVLRSDGTATYPVADLALASEKFKRHQLEKSLYVVDNRQTLYFKQLFKLLQLMGYHSQMIHLAYDFVKLPTGMMSSRTGNALSYRELASQVFDKLKLEIIDRHADWDEAQVVAVANKLCLGVLKFEMLKVGADKVIVFNLDEALRFDGFTSVYLQYTGARISSILRKAGQLDFSTVNTRLLTADKEKQLILNCAKYPSLLLEAFNGHNPSVIAKYAFDLAKLFNDYYQEVNILNSSAELKLARLQLLLAVRQVLTNALALLGIDLLEEM